MNTPTGSTALAVRINTLEADITELRDTIAQQAELLAAHKAEMQDWQRALLAAQQESADYRAALEWISEFIPKSSYLDGGACKFSEAVKAADSVRAALAKHSPEDEVERARRMV